MNRHRLPTAGTLVDTAPPSRPDARSRPAIENVAYFTLAPDWLCEVLSPSTEKLDRAKKLPVYASHGVRNIWLVNPLQRTLEVLRLCDGRWLTLAVYCDDAGVRAEPFDAIGIDLADLWADLPAPPPQRKPGRASELVAVYGDASFEEAP